MHLNNLHNKPYDFKALIEAYKELETFVFDNEYGAKTVNFEDPSAVYALNKAILISDYELIDWNIPEGYLCPPIPSRVDYIHHLADVILQEGKQNQIKGLDLGTGANCIYPILGAKVYDWHMVGCDIDDTAVTAAKANIANNPQFLDRVTIRHQTDHAKLFAGIIKSGEYYNFTMCNPPFYASQAEAKRAADKKRKGLNISDKHNRNFGGEAHELWCNGGEALFLKRMIKESSAFKNQVGLFTSLVSRSENLPKIKKQINKGGAHYEIIKMQIGNKQSRIVTWKF